MIKKYKLLRDLPGLKAGAIWEKCNSDYLMYRWATLSVCCWISNSSNCRKQS